jgi:ABC-type amino acid transport substrate-binding protein
MVLLVALLAPAISAGILFALTAREDHSLERILKGGTWRVAMDPSFPPFENLDAQGRPAGFDVDLAGAIAARWGVRAEIVPMGFDQILDAVSAGQVDAAISALNVVDYRAKELSFSSPYMEAGLVLAVSPGSPVRSAGDLAGRRVAVEWGSTGDAEARELQKQSGGKLALVLRESSDAALGAVVAGQADAALVDAISLALYHGGTLTTAGAPLRSDPYVVVVPARSPRLLGAVNDALAALQGDGTLDGLRARWLH